MTYDDLGDNLICIYLIANKIDSWMTVYILCLYFNGSFTFNYWFKKNPLHILKININKHLYNAFII